MPETPQTRRYLAALVIAAIAFLLLALTACKSAQPVATTTQADTLRSRHDTLLIFRATHDTLCLRDSVYIREVQRGDTVLITKFRDRTLYKTIAVHDTIYKSVGDTLQARNVEYKTVTQTVERDYTAWEKFRLKWFGVAVAVAIGLAGWTFRKPIWTLIRKLI